MNGYNSFNPTILTLFYVLNSFPNWHLSENISNGINNINVSLEHHLTQKKKLM